MELAYECSRWGVHRASAVWSKSVAFHNARALPPSSCQRAIADGHYPSPVDTLIVAILDASVSVCASVCVCACKATNNTEAYYNDY